MIMYKLTVNTIEIPAHRPYDTANWDLFKSELGNMEIYTPTIITQKKTG